jgi:hypothetical protein
VDDLAAARTTLEEAGAEVTEALGTIHGRDRLFTRDPVGNLVELVEFVEPLR